MSAAPPKPDPLSSLTQLSPTTYIDLPSTFTATSPTILLCTWMNASPRNIAFYITCHRRLFPSARIILLRGTIQNVVYVPESTQKAALQKVLEALRATEPRSPVVLHAFSNAGAQQASLLLRAFKEYNGGQRLKLKGVILDSCPGRGNYGSSYRGMSYEIPKSWPAPLRWLGFGLVHLVLVVAYVVQLTTRRPNVLDASGAYLNDVEVVGLEQNPKKGGGGAAAGPRRVYMYSKEDALVPWEDIEWHAAGARAKGWEVELVLFEGSAHCRHAKGEGEKRYWDVVRDVVARAGK